MRWIIWFWQMATMLNKVGPFFAILFSYFLLKETIAPYQIAALVATFCGCLLIIKPTGAGGELFPMLVALLGGISAGGASTMLRLLGKYGVKKSLIVFVFSLFSLLTAAPFLIFDYHPMTMQQTAMLLLAGVSAALGQFASPMPMPLRRPGRSRSLTTPRWCSRRSSGSSCSSRSRICTVCWGI